MKREITQGLFTAICALTLLSCRDINVIDVYQRALDGPKTTVKLVISTEFKEVSSNKTRTTAGDLNEGATLKPIQNAVVAAYVETGKTGFDVPDRSFNALNIGTIDLQNNKTTTRVMELPVGVVNFLFYGNASKGNWSGLASLNQGRGIADISFNLEDGFRSISNVSPRQYYQDPASLLYWSETTNQQIDPTGQTEQTINLTTVHYGVANLVTVVKDNTVDEGQITLAGVFIGNQPKSVDWSFTPIDYEQNKVAIYDNDINCPGTPAAPFLPSEYPNPLTPFNTNDYTLVFPTPEGQDIPISLGVTSTKDIELSNGITAVAGTLIHLPVVTIKSVSASATGYQVFKSDYKTIARFAITTLKNGDISSQPLITSKVTLDVTIDTEWQEGMDAEFLVY